MNQNPAIPDYLPYILAAYTVTFVLIGMMFISSYRKYRKTKSSLDSYQRKPDLNPEA